MEKIKSPDFLAEKPRDFLIVGLGASSGGIQALKEFFNHAPEKTGIAWVVILHLSPDHDSQLAHVLQVNTSIPVAQVTEKTKIEPDHIYVVPPNQHLIMEDRFVAPSINLYQEERRAPVDIFFRTLADTHGPRAVCVVLSGTGADGSMGLKRIKEMGGIAYVQNPKEAEFNEMPRNAIATGLVDEVLPVAEISGKIVAYLNSIGTIEIATEADQTPEKQQQALREIFTQLRVRTGHDFSNYKRPTLLRRIERRINIRNLPDLASYASFLHQNAEEANALLKDLLISVTNFFRDRKPFEAIETDVIPLLLKGKRSDDEIRIWVAGCATGEEAYSMAMLMAEQTLDIIDAPKIQIFATDINEAAINAAREGLYTINDAADVSSERLSRFFNKEGEGYRVKWEIREMVLFATHNFLKDPPFSRLDIITCRNVLIYLNSTAQERMMETFHFALKPGRFLFLGLSETVDSASNLFASASRENHIYQAREVSTRNYPIYQSVLNLQFTKFEPPDKEEKESKKYNNSSLRELHQKLLEQYAPPSIVVNEEYDVVHMSEKAGGFLEFPGGEPTRDLLSLIRPELRLELRAALYQALQRGVPVTARNLVLERNGRPQSVNLHVRPVTNDGDTTKGLILVIFEQNEDKQDDKAMVITSDEPVAKQLEEELNNVKAQLKTAIQQHEYQAEELKASNEELQAMNEELRSAAEELETSKEELQSINEELRTVNQELKVKIEETSVASDNLLNLVNSADVGTIFLDRNFRIQMYTPAVLEIFNLIPSDFGRPISDITHRLQYTNLLQDAEEVIERLTVVEREVTTTDHKAFMMRVLLYRTLDDRINGVVATFFDITKRKQAETALQQSEEHLRLLVESAKDYAIFTLDNERRVASWSRGAQEIFNYSDSEMIGKSGDIVFVPEDREEGIPTKEAETAEKEGKAENERWHIRKDGSRFWASGSTSPVHNSAGERVGYVKIMRDLKERRQMEEAKFFLASIVATSNDSVITISFERNITSWNKAAEKLYGYTTEEVIGKNLTMLTLPEDFVGMLDKVDAVQHSREVVVFDTVRHNKDGKDLELEIVMSPVLNTSGDVVGISTVARDVSERKRREENLAFLAEINLDFAPLLTVHNVLEPLGEHLANYLKLSRCSFSIIYEEQDRIEVIYEYRRDKNLPSVMGVHKISDNLTEEGLRHYRAGKVALINTTADNPLVKPSAQILKELGLVSVVDVPYVEGGKWRFLLTAARAEEGGWRADEVEVLQELTSKIYIRIQRARAEEALRRSEEKYRTIFETIDEGFTIQELLTDENGNVTDLIYSEVNEAYARHSGVEDAVGKKASELFPHLEQHWLDQMTHVYKTGEAVRTEGYQADVNRWFTLQYSRVGGPGSRLISVVFNDITEQTNARKKIEESEQNVRRLFMQAPAIIVVHQGPQHVYKLSNEVHQQLIGNRDLLGKPVREAMPELEGTGIYELLDRVYATGEPYIGNEVPLKVNRGDGKLKESYFNFVYQPTHNVEGEIDGIFVHGVEVTDQVLTRKKIEESEEQQAFLLKLSDALKELTDANAIQLTACRILGEHVKVNRVLYGEVIDEERITVNNNYVNGVPPIIATLNAEQFGKNVIDAFKHNEKVIISDINTDPRYSEDAKRSFLSLNVVANAGMGLVKGGRWVATIGMHSDA